MTDVLKSLRRRVILSWLAFLLSVALLWIQFQLSVLRPYAITFTLLLIVTVLSSLAVLLRGLVRIARGPSRTRAVGYTLIGITPVVCWGTLAWCGLETWKRREVPRNIPFTLLRWLGFSLMEVQAPFSYPRRLETSRLVMFYDERVTDPEGDIKSMDEHVARMEQETGLKLREKIHWVRGGLLGQGALCINGLALGSSQSPASWLDRHELAHAIIYQHNIPDTEPPTLLSEGWAVSQEDRSSLADVALDMRRPKGEVGVHKKWKGCEGSCLRELTGPDWYHQDSGPVYSIGGAFTEFLLKKHGTKKFLDLYFACRPGTFEKEIERVYGVGLDALEMEFWKDAEKSVSKK